MGLDAVDVANVLAGNVTEAELEDAELTRATNEATLQQKPKDGQKSDAKDEDKPDTAEDSEPRVAMSSSKRERRPRGSGPSGLVSRAEDFRAQAKEFREQAKSETGYRAENLNARADRADAAADRMEAAAGRAGGGAEAGDDVDQKSDGPDAATAKMEEVQETLAEVVASLPPEVQEEYEAKEQQLLDERGLDVADAQTYGDLAEWVATLTEVPEDEREKLIELLLQLKDLAAEVADAEDTTADADAGRDAGKDEGKPKEVKAAADSGQAARAASVGGAMSFNAVDAQASGSWRVATVGGQQVMVWDSDKAEYKSPPKGQTLRSVVKPKASGSFKINLTGTRIPSAMIKSDVGHKDRANDVYVRVVNTRTGEVVQEPTKLYTYFGTSFNQFKTGDEWSEGHSTSKATVSLQAGEEYAIELIGRSPGYAVRSVDLEQM